MVISSAMPAVFGKGEHALKLANLKSDETYLPASKPSDSKFSSDVPKGTLLDTAVAMNAKISYAEEAGYRLAYLHLESVV